MKRIRESRILMALCLLVGIAVYYYVALPVCNIHSRGTWKLILLILGAWFLWNLLPKLTLTGNRRRPLSIMPGDGRRFLKLSGILFGIVIALYLIGGILSSPVINASRYQKLMKVSKSEFTEDITQISYKQIPLLDKDSAAILGERKMGSLVDLASQFEVTDEYTQINYQGTPTRVTPLRYASLIKWFTNRKKGIPAFISIDMATKKTQLVRLKEGIRYSPYEHFGRNLYRHLRFRYPTAIFDDISFEIDDKGTPYWICSIRRYNIGLFGGETIGKAVLVNAQTGQCKLYGLKDVPSWVDRVFSADMLVRLYNYYGTLKHGFLNSVLGQKDCLRNTNGYNYLAINDDVWVYTGVTSITSDQSNVGFVLMNQRTMETKYYEVEGAIEDSAMTSAEGKVQNLGYRSTFPLLLNIDSQPTYFMALKDASGLVKKYAMVNVQDSQLVSTGDSVAECEKSYRKLLSQSGISDSGTGSDVLTVKGKVRKIAQAVVDGNTHLYLILEDSDQIYDVNLTDDLSVLLISEGDTVSIDYVAGEGSMSVMKISR